MKTRIRKEKTIRTWLFNVIWDAGVGCHWQSSSRPRSALQLRSIGCGTFLLRHS